MRAFNKSGMHMEIKFAITNWAAYAPSLSAPPDWKQWALQPHLPIGAEPPSLNEMPALHRRRLGALGRMAAKVAYECQRQTTGMPVVMASRYGDAARSLALLREHALAQTVSPTDFALSVHNAIAALYSIARGDGANFTSIASGPASCALALVEAMGLLHEGAPEVLVVCYDAPLPEEYGDFDAPPGAHYAWAWRVGFPRADRPYLGLHMLADQSVATPAQSKLPFGLDALRFALSTDADMLRQTDGTAWHWMRHG